MVKNSPANAGDTGDSGSIPGLRRSPGGGHSNPLQYSCLENPHGQRSLVGYSPWGCKESNMTKHACNHWLLRTMSSEQDCVRISPKPSSIAQSRAESGEARKGCPVAAKAPQGSQKGAASHGSQREAVWRGYRGLKSRLRAAGSLGLSQTRCQHQGNSLVFLFFPSYFEKKIVSSSERLKVTCSGKHISHQSWMMWTKPNTVLIIIPVIKHMWVLKLIL